MNIFRAICSGRKHVIEAPFFHTWLNTIFSPSHHHHISSHLPTKAILQQNWNHTSFFSNSQMPGCPIKNSRDWSNHLPFCRVPLTDQHVIFTAYVASHIMSSWLPPHPSHPSASLWPDLARLRTGDHWKYPRSKNGEESFWLTSSLLDRSLKNLVNIRVVHWWSMIYNSSAE